MKDDTEIGYIVVDDFFCYDFAESDEVTAKEFRAIYNRWTKDFVKGKPFGEDELLWEFHPLFERMGFIARGVPIEQDLDKQRRVFAKEIAENWMQHNGYDDYCVFCNAVGYDENMEHKDGCIVEEAATVYLGY